MGTTARAALGSSSESRNSPFCVNEPLAAMFAFTPGKERQIAPSVPAVVAVTPTHGSARPVGKSWLGGENSSLMFGDLSFKVGFVTC